jgi:hypothetical protein
MSARNNLNVGQETVLDLKYDGLLVLGASKLDLLVKDILIVEV